MAASVFERAKGEKERIRCQTISDKQCIETLLAFIGKLSLGWCLSVHGHGGGAIDQERLLVEPSCAAALSPLYDDGTLFRTVGIDVAKLQGPIVAVVCGGSGVSMGALEAWKAQVGL